MPRPSLSHLYFETISISKAPLKWLTCAAFIHAGLLCIPTGKPKPRDYGIAFRQGNAGIEVDLISESAESSPMQTVTLPDSSHDAPDSITKSPESDPVVVESEQLAAPPAEPSVT